MVLEIISLVGVAVSLTVGKSLQESKRLRSIDEAQINNSLRAMVGATARSPGMAGRERFIPSEDGYVEMRDVAFGPAPVLLSHAEFVWWMSTAQHDPSKFIPEVRGILIAQSDRRSECSAP